eukprot:TRINITY_DN11875_c0_g8_i1.p1 TRINITY_DN11875_c0_g8~~TRINITY_DN11875_c0_g8_i1.p1  ORF type:complete len:705 (-),score=167.47 TRINITY_DN11875_c0_g8_i1:171-2285(-)
MAEGEDAGALPPRYIPSLTTNFARRFVSSARELEHRGNINATCVDHSSFFTCGDSHLRQWNINSAMCERQWKIKDGKNVACMTSSDSGWLWCGKRNGVVQGVDTKSDETATLTQSDEAVVALCCCGQSGTVWALNEDGMVLQHDVKSCSIVFRASVRQHVRRKVLNFEVKCQPQIELANGEVWVLWCGSIFVIDEESGAVKLAKRLPRSDGRGEDPVTTMTRVHSARWCANASSRVTAWVNGELVGEVPLPKDEEAVEQKVCTSISRTPDGLLWCALSSGEVCLVSPGHEAVLTQWTTHNSAIRTLHAVSHKGKIIVSTLSEYGSVRLWNVNTEGLIEAYEHVQAANTSVSALTLNLRLLSWNVNEWSPFNGTSRVGVGKWLGGDGSSDIVVLGIQEAVPLNAQQAMAANTGVADEWEDYLKLCLDKVGSYVLLSTMQLVGVVIVVFVRSDFVHAVSEVETSVVKVGFKGLLGNKGAACVRFNLFEDSLLFICTHLAAGQKDVKARNEHFHSISEEIAFEKNDKRMDDHDHVFWFGDLNYRVDLPNDKVRQLCVSQSWDKLYQHDQLQQVQQDGSAFSKFDEAPIAFAPTYKYDHGTATYDSSKKKRAPAYCDRVLWRKSDAIRPRAYGRAELLQSDHRPVHADLELDVRIVVQQQPGVAAVAAPDEPLYNPQAMPPFNSENSPPQSGNISTHLQEAELDEFFG